MGIVVKFQGPLILGFWPSDPKLHRTLDPEPSPLEEVYATRNLP